jgi:hypothetical protein
MKREEGREGGGSWVKTKREPINSRQVEDSTFSAVVDQFLFPILNEGVVVPGEGGEEGKRKSARGSRVSGHQT